MKTNPGARHGFTLLELLTVIAIIVVLVSLIIGGLGHAQQKAASSRAAVEVAMLSSLVLKFKQDFGDIPRNHNEDRDGNPIQPQVNPDTDKFVPAASEPSDLGYRPYAGFLAYCLFAGHRGIPTHHDPLVTRWARDHEPPLSMVSTVDVSIKVRKGSNEALDVATKYLMDPFGMAYGYATSETFNADGEIWSYGGTVPKKKDGKEPERTSDGSFVMWSWVANW